MRDKKCQSFVGRICQPLLVLALLSGCGGDGDGGGNLPECQCDTEGEFCQISGGEPCVIKKASGDYTVSDGADVEVADGAANYSVTSQSTLTLLDGEANVGVQESTLLVDGGTLLTGSAGIGARVTISAGTVSELEILSGPEGSARSTVDVGGGTVHHLLVSGDSAANVDGGFIPLLESTIDSTVTIAGGRVARCEPTNLSIVTIDDGIVDRVFAGVQAQVALNGGRAGTMVGTIRSRLTVTGGEVATLLMAHDSSAVVSGGTVTSSLQTSDAGASITVVGSGFNYPYGPVEDIGGRLTGTLAGGEAIDVDFNLIDGIDDVPGTVGTLYLCRPDAAGDCDCPLDSFRSGACAPGVVSRSGG